MRFLCIVVLFGVGFLIGEEVNWSLLNKYSKATSYEQVKTRLPYLQKDSELENHYSLTREQLKIYSSLEAKTADQVEFSIDLATQAVPSEKKRLKGLKVAIDPGHFGGAVLSKIESRYIDMLPEKVDHKKVQFNEGELALLTALHLKNLLEQEGAVTFLTKEKLGQGVYPKSFFQWLEEDFTTAVENKIANIADLEERAAIRSWWLTRATLSSVFRSLYNPLDLKARADAINRFAPDCTIIIHYNAGGGNNSNGQNLGSKENFNMAFVPGSFLSGELSSQRARFEFARLLLTDDLDNSRKLSSQVVAAMEKNLNIPAVSAKEAPAYLKNFCKATPEKGVYARNLTLTRLVRGTLCYGESLYQDNLEESQKLAQKSAVVNGVETSPRVIQVAQSYFEGILATYGE